MTIKRLSFVLFVLALAFPQFGCGGSEAVPGEGAAQGSALAVLPSSMVVVAEGTRVVAYQPDGRQGWSFSLPDGESIGAAPVAALSSVTYVRGEQTLFAIAPDGQVLWQSRHQGANDTVRGITPLSDSTVAITREDRSLVGYSAQGQVKWTYTLPENEKLVAPPVLALSSIVYLRTAKNLYAVDSGGNLAWTAELGGK
jgi:outer membrane protein assembly factor BamB